MSLQLPSPPLSRVRTQATFLCCWRAALQRRLRLPPSWVGRAARQRASRLLPLASGSAAASQPPRASGPASLKVRAPFAFVGTLHAFSSCGSTPKHPAESGASQQPAAHCSAGAPPQALERVAQVPEQAIGAAAALLRASRSAAALSCIRHVAVEMGAERAAASPALAGAG